MAQDHCRGSGPPGHHRRCVGRAARRSQAKGTNFSFECHHVRAGIAAGAHRPEHAGRSRLVGKKLGLRRFEPMDEQCSSTKESHSSSAHEQAVSSIHVPRKVSLYSRRVRAFTVRQCRQIATTAPTPAPPTPFTPTAPSLSQRPAREEPQPRAFGREGRRRKDTTSLVGRTRFLSFACACRCSAVAVL